MSLIVVGFDGSDRSHDALALARELAEPAGAELLLATAVPYPALALVGEGIAVAVTREGAAAGARRLDQEIAALAADGLDVEGVVRPYDSAPQLLQALAQERDAALIVVGSASSGRLGRVLPGTTGERLLAGAPCPVAVAPFGHRLEARGRARRIGVAFDGSAEAHAALEAGAAMASNPGDTLEVIAVLDAFRYGAPALMGGPGYHRMRADVEAAARARLDTALAALPPAISARAVLLAGDPARELVERSRDLHLLIAGSRGYGPGRAVLLGGVSGRLVRDSACALIVVPRAEPHPLAALRPVAADAVPDR